MLTTVAKETSSGGGICPKPFGESKRLMPELANGFSPFYFRKP